jgi:hypothetical protein
VVFVRSRMGPVLHYDIVFFLSKYIVFIGPVMGSKSRYQPIRKGVVRINNLSTLCMNYLFSIIRKKKLYFSYLYFRRN